MALTFSAIATVTVGSGGTANIEFTNIPASYTDLKLMLSGRTSNNDSLHYGPIYITFNNDTSAIYDNLRLMAYGTTVLAGSDINQNNAASATNGSSATTSAFSANEYYIPNYASNVNKPWLADYAVETNDANNNLMSLAANWAETTSAISSIKIAATGGQTIVQYSTATLYGIKKN
jgi:hypothetical protein